MNAGEKLGPYEILSAIGAGGMGEVYKARDTRLDRTVAVKLLPDILPPVTTCARASKREARAVASLNHPNIYKSAIVLYFFRSNTHSQCESPCSMFLVS